MLGTTGGTSKAFWLILGFLLVVSCLKHAATFATGPTVLEYDALDYWERGNLIAHGDWWQQERAVNYRGPLYPLFLGICQWLFGHYSLFAISILQHVAQLFSGLLVAGICWRISRNPSTVIMGYTLSTLCITAPWYANIPLTESMFQLAMTATLGAIVSHQTNPSRNRAIWCGSFLGLATLTRPIPKLFWIPLSLAWWINSLPNRQVTCTVRYILWFGLAMLATTAPWSLRNWIFFENSSVAKVPPINKWVVCFHSDSAGDLPIPRTRAGNELRRLLPDIDSDDSLRHDGYEVLRRLQKLQLSDQQIDTLTTQVCLDSIVAHWPKFFWKTFKRFVNFWRCSVKAYPYYSTYGSETAAPPVKGQHNWRWEPIATWYETILRNSPSTRLRWMELDSLVCGIATLILLLRPRTRHIGVTLTLIFLYFAAITAALEIENYRYRMVLDPCSIVAIACGLNGTRSDRPNTNEGHPVASPSRAR